MEASDWRLRDQEEYLLSRKLIKAIYANQKSDHSHCEFCWHKFMENCNGVSDCSDNGYVTCDGTYWICNKCFDDFKNKFKWSVV